jgi:hypothetical protein
MISSSWTIGLAHGALIAKAFAGILLLGTPQPAHGQGVIVDRVLAVVDGQLVTLSDLRATAALRLVEGPDEPAVLASLVDRLLILGEASRYAVQEPSGGAIDERLAALRDAVGESRFRAILRDGGLSESVLRQWVRDDLVVESYMTQRFASAAMPTDAEVDEYARTRGPELAASAGLPASPEDVTKLARERLANERRARLVADWVAGLRRRSEVSLRAPVP